MLFYGIPDIDGFFSCEYSYFFYTDNFLIYLLIGTPL